MNKKEHSENELPKTPGVYLFKAAGEILYIGKATSLRDRTRSYFASDLIDTRGLHIVKMVETSDEIAFIETDSVLEALLLETQLIKKHKPAFNTREKDNKSHTYVVITEEAFPRVFPERGRILSVREKLPYKIKHQFGPFLSTSQVKEVLKIVRKIFPCRGKKSNNAFYVRFYKQLGLTPGEEEFANGGARYKENIKNIKALFEGRKRFIVIELKKKMNNLAKELKFEEADVVKTQILSLEHIKDMALLKNDFYDDIIGTLSSVRVEGYDVAHISGTNQVGVMVVMDSGEMDRTEYRMFHIKGQKKADDLRALEEVLRRRFRHPEWKNPDIIVMDGGESQRMVAVKLCREIGLRTHILSVVKDKKHNPREILGKKTEKITKDQVKLVNHEAHRFALSFHIKTRRKNLTRRN